MSAAIGVAAFVAGAVVSLATSWLLVSRLERVGERLGLSEALLGVVAALAADAPEVTAAVSATAGGEQRLGAGVVIGSNVFNLAALLGLGAVVAGRIGLHRKVVLLGGTAAMAVAGVCLAAVLGVVPPAAGWLLGLFVVALYVAALGVPGRGLARVRLPRSWIAWLRSAVAEEEAELESAIRPAPARWPDVLVAAGSLVIVVAASVTMERAAAALGTRFAVPEIVVGGLVLAAVTSLPNAVAAVYLAARGRGAATLSTALNSNTINVTAGLLVPAALLGLGRPSGQTILAAVWYIGLTGAVLAFAYRDRGIRRATGILVIAAYLIFAASVLGLAYTGPQATRIVIMADLAVAVVFAGWLALGRHPDASTNEPDPVLQRPARPDPDDQIRGKPAEMSANGSSPETARTPMVSSRSGPGRESVLAGWPVRRLWVVGLAASLLVAAADAALGTRAILIGLLIIGPCCVVLTGRWVPTALTGVWVTGLAVVLGLPDGIWGTAIFFTWLGAVAVVALASTAAAAFIQAIGGPPRLR
ncbi:MAG TPA: hypothetical protein VIY52_21645 [Streptosporangiaceae bacterium]